MCPIPPLVPRVTPQPRPREDPFVHDQTTTETQAYEQFAEPPREVIPQISRAHVTAMEADADAMEWEVAGMRQLVLRTVGRRSGNEHKVALPFWLDDRGDRIVAASFSGAPQHPAWYINLTDRAANPRVRIHVQHEAPAWVDAVVLQGEEYEATWSALCADRPFYAVYQTRTDRQIPLVRFVDRTTG